MKNNWKKGLQVQKVVVFLCSENGERKRTFFRYFSSYTHILLISNDLH